MADPRGVNFEGHWKDHYWHNEAKQKRYEALIGGNSRQDEGQAREVAEALNVDEQLVTEAYSRLDAAFSGLDTADLDDAFLGLSDRVKQAWCEACISPQRLPEIEAALTPAEIEEAKHFVESLTPEERRAVDRVLWL